MEQEQKVSHKELLLGFNTIAMSGFGGVMAWARRVIVEQRGWLSSEEFTTLFALCQFMPGPNVVNLAVCVGSRFQGFSGVLVSLAGVLTIPVLIVIAMGALYGRFGEIPAIQSMLNGISAVAAGMILAMGLKMAADLLKRPVMLIFTVLIMVAILIFKWPLPFIMLALAPLSMLTAATRYCKKI